MDRTERFYKIEMMIRNRRPDAGYVSFNELMNELGVSRATLKRDVEYLRERLDAPIVYDRFYNGYKFDAPERGSTRAHHQLPGVWFSERELHALLTMHHLIRGLDEGGVLARHLQPLLDKLHGMLGSSDKDAEELAKRVKIVSPARRPVPAKYFELVGTALTQRKRIEIVYFAPSTASETARAVSPQRLVYNRNTWYLDAWCHAGEGLRRFSLDAIQSAALLDERARDVAIKTLEVEFDSGYGAYGGGKVRHARLAFSANAARWVANESWHPRQQTRWRPDGRFEIILPYTSVTELAMDVMRHGPDVEVEGDEQLRRHVAEKTRKAAAVYVAGTY